MAGNVRRFFIFTRLLLIVWGRGSEVVFELYSSAGQYYIRVMWSGQPMITSLPFGNNGTLDMVPVNDFFDCVSLSPGYPPRAC